MAVGSTWYKNSAGVWVTGMPHYKHPTQGWIVGGTIYEKTSSTVWTVRYTGDITPPAAPPLWVNTYDVNAKTMTSKITASSDADVVQVCTKLSKTGYPTNPGVQDGNGPTDVQADGTPFWLYTTTPGAVSTRTHTGMIGGQKYYQSVWCKDSAGNWSAPTNWTWTQGYPTTVTKTLTTKSAYVSTTDSASWRSAYGWRTDNNYVIQAGTYNDQGFWFYGTAIASMLKNANTVTKMEIYIQRVNSAHGVNGPANIFVGHHGLTSQPSGSPSTNAITNEYNIVDLSRGQGAWVTITSGWYASFKSGAYRGLGCQYGTTSVTSSYYANCYGHGTSSGQLKLTWTEYV